MKTKKTSHGPNDQALRQAVWFPENGFGLHIPYEFPDQVLSKTPWIPTILMKALWIECHVRFLALATCRGHWARCLTSIAMSGLTKLLTFEPASIMPWRVRAQVWNKTAWHHVFSKNCSTKKVPYHAGHKASESLDRLWGKPKTLAKGFQSVHLCWWDTGAASENHLCTED